MIDNVEIMLAGHLDLEVFDYIIFEFQDFPAVQTDQVIVMLIPPNRLEPFKSFAEPMLDNQVALDKHLESAVNGSDGG
jgi:hypothetical protein